MKIKNKSKLLCLLLTCLLAISIAFSFSVAVAQDVNTETEIKNAVQNMEETKLNNATYQKTKVGYDDNYIYYVLTSSRIDVVVYIDADNSGTANSSTIRFYVYTTGAWEVQYGNGTGFVTDTTKDGVHYFVEQSSNLYISYFRISLSKIGLSEASKTIGLFEVGKTAWADERNPAKYEKYSATNGSYLPSEKVKDDTEALAYVKEKTEKMVYFTELLSWKNTGYIVTDKPSYDSDANSVSKYLGCGFYADDEYFTVAVKRDSNKIERTVQKLYLGGDIGIEWTMVWYGGTNYDTHVLRPINYRYNFYNDDIKYCGSFCEDGITTYYMVFERAKLAALNDGEYDIDNSEGGKILIKFGQNYYLECYNGYYYTSREQYLSTLFSRTEEQSFNLTTDKPEYDTNEDSTQKYLGYKVLKVNNKIYFAINRQGDNVQRSVLRATVNGKQIEIVITNTFAGLRMADKSKTIKDSSIVEFGHIAGESMLTYVAVDATDLQAFVGASEQIDVDDLSFRE